MMGPQPAGAPASGFPRQLVLASAGTGKTFTLTTRIIGLLALGVPADELLASTFTRKAAGEIMTRTLARLADAGLDAGAAVELRRHALPGPSPESVQPPCDEFLDLLSRVLADIHRLNIGTLDSFFGRVARTFPLELGLPPDWTIADEPTARIMDSEALQSVLRRADGAQVIELVRMTMRGEPGRSVHDRLLRQLGSVREVLHLLDPAASMPWCPFPGLLGSVPPSPQVREELSRGLETAPVPLTAKGSPDRSYQKAVTQGAADLREGMWTDFCRRGLGAKVLAREETYYGKEIPDDLRRAVEGGLDLARRALGREINEQAGALERLAVLFQESVTQIQSERGAYRFQDIAFLLGGTDPIGMRPDLWYRLDQQARHLLLDEFQDTSLAQWEAIAPLADEILSVPQVGRSAVIVADPKQSIYGWRGAEPGLVHRVGERFGLDEVQLRDSYRSSQVVLDFVNRVFENLAQSPFWEEGGADVAMAWLQDFLPHRAATQLEGYVGIHVGPREDSMNRTDRPAMMAWAAQRLGDILEGAEGKDVGVLVRTNQAVARLTFELRRLGIEASEEGATALTDSPAVSTILALIRFADHPGDTVSRYQVVQSPLRDCIDPNGSLEGSEGYGLASRVRREIAEEGYGVVLARWIRELHALGALDGRDLPRLTQLMELGFQWDARSTLRPRDFVEFVESERMESLSDARIRVMTVHQAKGLEFDLVVLPELDTLLTRGTGRGGGLLPLRDLGTGRILKVFPRISSEVRTLFPEVEEAWEQERQNELRDALGLLYVALTRARHALHLFVAADPDASRGKTPRYFSGLIRESLGLSHVPFRLGETVWEAGDPDWSTPPPPEEAATADQGRVADRGTLRPMEGEAMPVFPPARGLGRQRFLQHRTPSSWTRPEKVDLGRSLLLGSNVPRFLGSVVHAWLQEMEWLDEWAPSPESLLEVAAREAPQLSHAQVEDQMTRLEVWLRAGEIRGALRREAYPSGAEVFTELPFAVRLEDSIVQGRMDRVVLWKEGSRCVGAHVLDFKTDAVALDDEEALGALAFHYRGQMRAYREALARVHGLRPEDVRATLLFLAVGRAVDV